MRFTNFLFSLAILLTFGMVFAKRASAADMTMYRQKEVVWKSVLSARSYNIYYKEKGAKQYQHAVGNLPSSSVRFTIGYLKKGVAYVYNVSALNDQGKEFWWSGEKPL